MLEMHLRLKDLCKVLAAYLQKKKEKIQKFKETADSRYIYQNELDKTGSQHDMVYRDFKNLTRRTASDKILRDQAFNIAKNTKYDGYQRGISSIVYRCFSKSSALLPR